VNLLAGEAEIGSGGCARSKRLADEYALFVGAAACLKGLRVYLAEGDTPPVELLRPPSFRRLTDVGRHEAADFCSCEKRFPQAI